MAFGNQRILPAIRKPQDLEKLLGMPYEYAVLLETHIGMLKPLVDMAGRHGVKLLLHADLIDGLKSDEYGAEYLCQAVKPAGLISTKSAVIAKAKANRLLAIQRLFLLDTHALEKSYRLLERTNPDYIEVLPGVVPFMITEVLERTRTPVFAGGLIRTVRDVELALEAGASAVTTSSRGLWEHFRGDR